MTPSKLTLTGSIMHGGREYHRGDPVPEGTEKDPVDIERLKRLDLVSTGKVEPEPDTD